jgi:hypothetical protein
LERRWREREAVAWKARVWFRNQRMAECTIKDIASDGMYIEVDGDPLPVGAQVSVVYVSRAASERLVCAKGLVVHSEAGGAGLLTRIVECGEKEHAVIAA